MSSLSSFPTHVMLLCCRTIGPCCVIRPTGQLGDGSDASTQCSLNNERHSPSRVSTVNSTQQKLCLLNPWYKVTISYTGEKIVNNRWKWCNAINQGISNLKCNACWWCWICTWLGSTQIVLSVGSDSLSCNYVLCFADCLFFTPHILHTHIPVILNKTPSVIFTVLYFKKKKKGYIASFSFLTMIGLWHVACGKTGWTVVTFSCGLFCINSSRHLWLAWLLT